MVKSRYLLLVALSILVGVSSTRMLQDPCEDEPLDLYSVRGSYLCTCKADIDERPVTDCHHRCELCHSVSDVCFTTQVIYSVNPIASAVFRRSVVTWQYTKGIDGNVTLDTNYAEAIGKFCTVLVNGETCSCIEGPDACYRINCNQGSSLVGGTTYDSCSGTFEGPEILQLLESPLFVNSSNLYADRCESASPTQSPTNSPTASQGQSAITEACEATEQNVQDYVGSDHECLCSSLGNTFTATCSQVCRECFESDSGPACTFRSDLRIELNVDTGKEKTYRTELRYVEGRNAGKTVVVFKQFESMFCTVSKDFEPCSACELQQSPNVRDETCMILNCSNLPDEGIYNECTNQFDSGGAIVFAAFGRPALRPDLPSQHQVLNRQQVCSPSTFFPASRPPTSETTAIPTPSSTPTVIEESSDENSNLAALALLGLIPIGFALYCCWIQRGAVRGNKEDQKDFHRVQEDLLEEVVSEPYYQHGPSGLPDATHSSSEPYLPGNKDQCQTVLPQAAQVAAPVYLPEHKDQCRSVVPPGNVPMAEAVPMDYSLAPLPNTRPKPQETLHEA